MQKELKEAINSLPSLPQRQDSTAAQLEDLRMVANRLGMYDAADAILGFSGRLDELRFGCYCDIFDGQEPDSTCLLEEGDHTGCIEAQKLKAKGLRKEACPYWQVIEKQ